MLNYSPDVILICTDRASQKANSALQRTFADSFEPFQKFVKLPLDIQLKKIFGEEAKDVKHYYANDILENPNFDYVEGIIKQ